MLVSYIPGYKARYPVTTLQLGLPKSCVTCVRRDLKFVLGPSRLVSFGRRTRRPPVELYPRVRAESQVEGTEEARRRTVAGPVGPAATDTSLIVPLVPISTVP